jgi:hypothetical protein
MRFYGRGNDIGPFPVHPRQLTTYCNAQVVSPGPQADITAVSRLLDACWQKMNADRWVPIAHGQQRNAL